MRYGHKEFRVGVFPHGGKRTTKYHAYLRDYNPEWSGCCAHTVIAEFGWEAKMKAIADHKSGTECNPTGKESFK